MDMKKYLQQAYWANLEFEAKMEQIMRLQALASKVTTELKIAPSSGNRLNSKVESAVMRIEEESDKLAECIVKLAKNQREISESISKVKNEAERTVLEYRYLRFCPWQIIAAMMKLSLRRVYELHNEALKNFRPHLVALEKT